MSPFKICTIVIGVASLLSTGARADDAPATGSTTAPVAKKLIYYGWNMPDTRYVREHWREMEQMPFDGTGIEVAMDRTKPVRGDDTTSNRLSWNVFGPTPLKLDDFRPAIDDLKSAQWTKFTDNFIAVAICSKGQDGGFNWFDEDRWKTIANNWRVLMTVAREGGCKGVMLDVEHYGVYLFNHDEMRPRVDRPYEEYAAKVRQRGRELMKVTREVYPDDVVILCLWSYPLVWREVRDEGGTKAVKPLAQANYGLLVPLLDGMLDEAPPGARLVDGYEGAYGYEDDVNFTRARAEILTQAVKVSAVPELYARHVEVGFGLWLDYEQKWDTSNFAANVFKPDTFRDALTHALDVSERYVWVYTEAPGFFPRARLPDEYLRAIEAGRAPDDTD